MYKDSVELICNVSELASLFESEAGIEGFLQKVVSLVAYHMRAAVCSVFLFDESAQELVLTANQGLNPDFVGKLRLKLGEGITGLALKELRPIREGRGSSNPNFKSVPGSFEERYQAFLAVPIVHGLRRVGVLVVEDPQPDYFDDNDVRALRAITAQLASTIESARLLISLHGPPQAPAPAPVVPAGPRLIRGTAACGGIAMGPLLDITGTDQDWLKAPPSTLPLSEQDFQHSLAQTEDQLADLQRQLGERMAEAASLIFDAHVLILKDKAFSGDMLDRIRAGTRPDQAIRDVTQKYVDLFARSANAALREKVHDVRDLGLRLLANLTRRQSDAADYDRCIVVATDLLPSDILKLSAQRAAGLVLIGGGVTAHVAVLARSLRLPLIIIKEPVPSQAAPSADAFAILDADQGTLLLSPTPDVVQRYTTMLEARRTSEAMESTVQPTSATRDGQRVRLMASINLLSELPLARRLKAEGIGLYRSEFPFIVRNDVPSEEEQFRIYRALLDGMPGQEVVLRTLDVGGDKVLAYYPGADEANPFLGLRAIRFSLRNRDIFIQQLRAMLRAGAGRALGIMFPLVSSVDDFLEARQIVADCAQALKAEGVACNDQPRVGAMIEVPSAVELSPDLAQVADFLCIGSNDLIQYTLAVDRTNANIADYYVPHHPAVLRSIKRVADAAAAFGKPVSLCGDMATDERLLPFLVGVGIHTLSMDAQQIPRIQQVIGAIDAAAARLAAEGLLKLGSVTAVAARLNGQHPQPATPPQPG